MITNLIQLDFNKENDLKVPSVQYDSGSRFVKIKLQRNKSPFEIDGYRVTVVANKVDGTEIMNDCTILDGVNGVVQFEITEQFNAVEGVVDCQLKLFKGKTLLTSMPFSINVVKSVSTKEIVSSNELKTLVNALGEVQDIDNRFAQTNAQLEHIENNNINIKYITAKSLGIYPNMPEKETEFSSMLQDFLLQYANDYIIFFDKGTYYLSGINVNFKKDTIISLQGVSIGTAIQDVKTIINTRGKDFIKDTSTGCNHRITASDIRFTSTGQQGKCFSSTGAGEFNFNFNTVYISHFDVGFEVPNWSCGGSGGENITFNDNRTGAILGTSSHLFYAKNLSLNHNRLGIDFKNGGNNATIEAVHIATGYSGKDKDDFDEFIGIKVNGGLTINGLYTEDYVGGGTYQAYKQIAIDYAYKGYGLPPLVCNGVNIHHAEGRKQDKGIRFTQLDANNNLQRFYTDKLIMNNVQTFDMTAVSLPSEFQQLGILINGENMYNDKAGTILFNRPKYTLNKKNFILNKGFGTTIDSISWNRMKFGDDNSLAKQCDIYYENRVNKDLIPIMSEYISLLYTNTFSVKLKMDIFTENNEASYINCKLTNFDTTIVDIKALKTPYGYKIDFEDILIAPNNNGFKYFAITFEGNSVVWGSETDLYLDIEQLGSCRNS